MEYGSRSTIVACMLALAWGCGDDDPGGSGSGTDSDDGTGTMSTTGVMTGSTTASTTLNTDSAEGGSSESSDGGDSSGGGTGAEEVMLGGRTQDFIGNAPIPGSMIHVFGMDALSDVADDQGMFEVGPLPPDTPVALVLDAAMVGNISYVGAIVPERTGTADRSDVIASQINRTIIDEQIMNLEDQMPQMADLDQAVVVVMVNPFAGGASLADGTVTVTMDPPPEAGTFYAADAMGYPILDSSEIGYQLIPAAVFFNLPDTQPGDITVTVEHSVPTAWTCSVDHPEWPTLGAYTTLVLVTCEEA